MAPILLSKGQTQQETQQGSVFFLYFLITGYYMWKRWHLFGMPVETTMTAIDEPRFDPNLDKQLQAEKATSL